MNVQKPEPRATGDGSILDSHSCFFTIQGEGPFAGQRAVFIRLAGCNLQCPGCDTEYTKGREQLHIDTIVNRIFREVPTPDQLKDLLVVITGGEPLRQPIGKLVDYLIDLRFRVQIESNGVFAPDETLRSLLMTLPRQSKWLQLVVSPKTGKVHPECHRLASAFKYVLDHRSVADDGLPIMALEHPAKHGVARPSCTVPVYLNPFDAGNAEDNAKNLAAVAASAMKHGYIAGVQLHKYMNLA